MSRLILLLFLTLGLSGCTYALHMAAVQDVAQGIRGKDAVRIKAEAEQFTVMGFASETDYVNRAYADLQKRCPKGEITGINARFSTAHGFFSWTNKVHLSGWCLN